MDWFSGNDPWVYVLGEPFEVSNAPLIDCGDGWDWRLPEGLHYWRGDVEFEVWHGEWEPIEPQEIHYRSGAASFSRCLDGLHVRASGVCHPTSLLAASEKWELKIASVLHMAPTFGEFYEAHLRNHGASVFIPDLDAGWHNNALVILPFLTGSFIGCGALTGIGNGATVNINDEGVVYESARP